MRSLSTRVARLERQHPPPPPFTIWDLLAGEEPPPDWQPPQAIVDAVDAIAKRGGAERVSPIEAEIAKAWAWKPAEPTDEELPKRLE
jgi:hypothetical protein